MEVLEIILLIFAYTLGIITLFIEAICYYRKIEILETIFFTASVLLFIVTITISYFFKANAEVATPNIFILISMILMGLATLLNILAERQHSVKPLFKQVFIGVAIALSALVLLGSIFDFLHIMQYVVASFLGLSVIYSMILIRMTKPRLRIEHREKVERITALACLIVLPLSLGENFIPGIENYDIKIGFALPMLFIFLTAGKLWDDIQRLSLFKPENKIKEQSIKNYSFTKREKEVVELLIKGATYKQIAEELFISMPTVKTHISNIYKKTGVSNKIELVALLSS